MKFHGREAAQIENDLIRVTVLQEGGHVAEVLHKASGINPLWIPPWPSIEPSSYRADIHPEYGGNSESKLLAGIMGHNLCLDMFGPPSEEEAASGLTVHGEASVVPYRVDVRDGAVKLKADLPLAGLHFERLISLRAGSESIQFEETVENLLALDRPIAWTQHVTLGPPFLQHGKTQFTLQAEKSRTFETVFGKSTLAAGTDFSWPMAPLANGGKADLSTFTADPSSAKFTTHLLNKRSERVGFAAYDPLSEIEFGYDWQCTDSPWLGIWEENRSRADPPWNLRTVTCGMEFGASPFPETRKEMIDRGTLFGVPGFRWLKAKDRVTARYSALIRKRAAD